MAKHSTRTVYRDTKTGRFVSKTVWHRSESKRYKRQRVQVRKKKLIPPARGKAPAPPAERYPAVFEWVVSFSYNRSGRSFDVIVTATSSLEAREVAKEFLRSDIDGQRIARSNFRGWSAAIARGNATSASLGNAEYRSKSRAQRKKRPQ